MSNISYREVPMVTRQNGDDLLNAALSYTSKGLPIFPCNPSSKAPLTQRGFHDATIDELAIREWWARWPEAMIGMPTGKASGVWVLDVDDPHLFESACGIHIPPAQRCETGKGFHSYFCFETDRPVLNRQRHPKRGWPFPELPGAETRGEGGYVILPPSLHPNGKRYRWVGEMAPAIAPDTLLEIVRRPSGTQAPEPENAIRAHEHGSDKPYGLAALETECATIRKAHDGEQEAALNEAALKIGALVAGDELSLNTARTQLITASLAMPSYNADHPWRIDEIIAKIQRGLADGARNPRSALNNSICSSAGAQRETPRPLYREMPPPAPFPTKALGPVLGRAAKAIEAVIQCPLECAANSVLAVAALAAQGRANIILPIGQGKSAPLSLYLLTVLESGERKSSADAMALKPVRDFESELHQAEATERQVYAAKLATHETSIRHLTNTLKKDPAALETALYELGPTPRAPLLSVLAPSGDQTMEGLFRIYQNGYPSLGMLCDDAATFLGGHSLKAEQKTGTTANLCRAWDGSKLERIRGGDGVLVLYDRRLACHLMVQPGVAAGFLSDEQFADQGLLARFLVSAPAGRAGTRFRVDGEYQALSKQAVEELEPYNAAISLLLRQSVRWKNENDRAQGVTMASLHFTDDARARFVEFANEIEAELSTSGSLAVVKAFASKLPENAARIAGTLTLLVDPKAGAIEVETFTNAVLMAKYYLAEALRLRATGMIAPALRHAEALRQWLLERSGNSIGLRQVYRLGPNAIRQASTARATMKVLEDHGWAVAIEGGATIDGEFAREAWNIIRPAAAAELSPLSQLSKRAQQVNEMGFSDGKAATVATPATTTSRSAKVFAHFLGKSDTDFLEFDL